MAHALDRHVALIGFMGAGKSTLGAEIAQRLGRRLVDLDREIAQTARQTVPELFEQRGEAEFRVLEAHATIEALAVVAEAAVAFELARAARDKFGGDSLADFVAAHGAYVERIPWRTR